MPCATPLILHVDYGAHPRVNAALKTVDALSQLRHHQATSLGHSSGSYIGIRDKASGALRNRIGCPRRIVKRGNESVAELCDFCEGVDLASLVGRSDGIVLLGGQTRGVKKPGRVTHGKRSQKVIETDGWSAREGGADALLEVRGK